MHSRLKKDPDDILILLDATRGELLILGVPIEAQQQHLSPRNWNAVHMETSKSRPCLHSHT